MSFELVGQYTLNFSTANDVSTGALAQNPGLCFNWLISADPLSDTPKDLYILVIPVYTGPGVFAEGAPVGKFFSKGFPTFFPIATPNAADFNGSSVFLRLLLKSVGGKKPNRTLSVTVRRSIIGMGVGSTGLNM